MNLCIDCIHFRRAQMLDSKGVCYHPQAVISRSPIDGAVTYQKVEVMRHRDDLCRNSGVLFQPMQAGKETTDSSLFDRMKRWFP